MEQSSAGRDSGEGLPFSLMINAQHTPQNHKQQRQTKNKLTQREELAGARPFFSQQGNVFTAAAAGPKQSKTNLFCIFDVDWLFVGIALTLYVLVQPILLRDPLGASPLRL